MAQCYFFISSSLPAICLRDVAPSADARSPRGCYSCLQICALSHVSFCWLQEVVAIVRAQLVGIMDGMKAGSLMEGHSWLEEAAAAAEQVVLFPFVCQERDT